MEDKVKIGLTLRNLSPADEPLVPSELITYAVTAEDLGFSSLFVLDHLFLGTKRPFPILESLSVLALLAGVTERIRLGTGVLVLPLRDPTTVAKVTSTIDVLSGGRLILGVGAGWYEKEFDALGIPFERRGKILVRNLEILTQLWSSPNFDYEAEGVGGEQGGLRFKSVVMEPKPLQLPRPLIIMGGYVDVVFRRIATHADGWVSYLYGPEDFADAWSTICQYAEREGRDPATLKNFAQMPICVGNSFEEADRRVRRFVDRNFDLPPWSKATLDSAIRGTPEQCAEQIHEQVVAGVQELVLMPCDYDLEQVQAIAEEVRPLLNGHIERPDAS